MFYLNITRYDLDNKNYKMLLQKQNIWTLIKLLVVVDVIYDLRLMSQAISDTGLNKAEREPQLSALYNQ